MRTARLAALIAGTALAIGMASAASASPVSTTATPPPAPLVTCTADHNIYNAGFNNFAYYDPNISVFLIFQGDHTNYCVSNNSNGENTWTQYGTGKCLGADNSAGSVQETSAACGSVYGKWAEDSGAAGTRLRNPALEKCIWDIGTEQNVELKACSATNAGDNFEINTNG